MGSIGTFGYMAPEMCSEGVKPSLETDMYAFGMVVYEVITGADPFGRRTIELPMYTIRGGRPQRPEDPVAAGFGQGTWEFVEECWDENWERRPTARETLEHFEHVAKTSMVVDPGRTIPDKVLSESESDDDSYDYSECHSPDSISPL